MWYEIIPSCAIIAATFFIPQYCMYHLIQRGTGQVYMKEQQNSILRAFFIRDSRVNNGSFCAPKLEDVLPDEPAK